MVENYFTKFPTIIYDNKVCIDITKRCKIVSNYLRSPTAYYNYQLTDGERADNLAYNIYEDPYYDWLIWLSNEVVDPYYDWYMSSEQFSDYIKDAYGSMETALKKTKFYRNNWYGDDIQISSSFYENTLEREYKKYYTPIFGFNTKIVSYKRKEIDTVMNTNKVVKAGITYANGSSFANGEIIDFKIGGTTLGSAEVITSNSTYVVFQHVESAVNDSIYIVGETSKSNAAIANVTTLHTNINENEAVFWERVSMYDFDNEQNEQKKFLKLVGPEYALPIADEIKRKMKE